MKGGVLEGMAEDEIEIVIPLPKLDELHELAYVSMHWSLVVVFLLR